METIPLIKSCKFSFRASLVSIYAHTRIYLNVQGLVFIGEIICLQICFDNGVCHQGDGDIILCNARGLINRSLLQENV